MIRSPDEHMRRHISLYLEEIRSVEKLYEQYAKSAGLTYMALSILGIIHEMPNGCTQKLIGERTCLPKQSVNAVVRGFWKQGYIVMNEMDSDRRNKEICLSESGRKYADEVMETLYLAEESALSKLTNEQQDRLVALMQLFGNSFRESFRRAAAK